MITLNAAQRRELKALRERSVESSVLLDKHITLRIDQIVEVVKAGYAEIYTRKKA